MVRILILFFASILLFNGCKSETKATTSTPKKVDPVKTPKKANANNLIGFKDHQAVTTGGKLVEIPGLADEKQSTYFLVRHAEKQTGVKNPGLTEAGLARAAKLTALLSGLQIDQIMSTDYKRTQATVAPLAKAHKINVQSYDPSMQKDLFTDLTVFNKQNVVVVGHSNTIPKLANILIGKEVIENYPESEYSQLIIISLSQPGMASFERFTF
jgi:Fructose-2,6-bisphosphatase